MRMAAVSAERSPQTWGTRPWQLWFLISRQPPPGPADKGSNGPICVPSLCHPEFPLHSTHNKVSDGEDQGPVCPHPGWWVPGSPHVPTSHAFPLRSWGIQSVGGRVSQTPRSVIKVLANTYFLPKARHCHHHKPCEVLHRPTVWNVEGLSLPMGKRPQPGFTMWPPRLSLHVRLSQDPVPKAMHTPPIMLHSH